MGTESINGAVFDQSLDMQIVILFERLESIRRNSVQTKSAVNKCTIQHEIRTLEFWRSITSECLAAFFYVFIVSGAATGAGVGASVSSVLLATALASGLTMGTLTHCFVNVSGAHVNPAVSLAAFVARSITPLRFAMYVVAQCGGGIAGAALLYGVTESGYQGNLQAAISQNSSLVAWERLAIEFILTCVVTLSYFVATEPLKRLMGISGIIVGSAYSACSFVSMPYLNPARYLGTSFVLNKWEYHWVYLFGPLIGGVASGLIYEYIFSGRRNLHSRKMKTDHDSSLMPSEDERNFDLDLDKQNGRIDGYQHNRNDALMGGANTLPAMGEDRGNLYARTPTTKQTGNEPIYGGTRSLYCRSPTLGRPNLNRSQSVYAKSQTAINKDNALRSGPLVPAQSLYPMRVQPGTQSPGVQTISSHAQNLQNQMQQHSDGIYGVRNSTRQSQQHQRQQQQQQQLQPPSHGMHHHQNPYHAQKQNIQHSSNQKADHNEQPQQQQQQPQPQQYVARQNTSSGEENITFEGQPPEAIYGKTSRVPSNPNNDGRNIPMQRVKRGQSVQSDDSSYGSYHGATMPPPQNRYFTEPSMLMYPAPPPLLSQSHQSQSPNMQPNVRTQSERKNVAPVVTQNAPLGIATYTVSAPTHPQPNQHMYMTNRPEPEHYSLLSMRSN